MEVSLPRSGVANPAPARAGAAAVAATGVNPSSVTLPLCFILTGIVALLVGVGWLLVRPAMLSTYHYNQQVIAATHLFVLGWICSVIMGAMYQLVPVALETRLYSERLARWQFVFHVVGFAGMVWMFRVWNLEQVGHFGSVLALGVGLFVYNLARTLLRVPRWNVVATAVAAALVWLSIVVLFGLSIAASKCVFESAATGSPAGSAGFWGAALRCVSAWLGRFDQISAMHAHAHLGGLGFILMLIVGVSYKLVPMFTLSEVQSKRRAAWSVGLLNIGLIGTFVSILLRSPWKPTFALVVITGLAVYGWEMVAILRARKRRTLDWGLRYFFTALGLLAPLSALAFVLSWPRLPLTALTGQLENLYGLVALIGVVTFAILGMLYKIIPFLVWFGAYSQHIGRSKVPALAELYSESWQKAGYGLFVAGLVTTAVGTLLSGPEWVRAGAVLLALSLTAFVVNVARILSHLLHPKIEPLPSRRRDVVREPGRPGHRALARVSVGAQPAGESERPVSPLRSDRAGRMPARTGTAPLRHGGTVPSPITHRQAVTL